MGALSLSLSHGCHLPSCSWRKMWVGSQLCPGSGQVYYAHFDGSWQPGRTRLCCPQSGLGLLYMQPTTIIIPSRNSTNNSLSLVSAICILVVKEKWVWTASSAWLQTGLLGTLWGTWTARQSTAVSCTVESALPTIIIIMIIMITLKGTFWDFYKLPTAP